MNQRLRGFLYGGRRGFSSGTAAGPSGDVIPPVNLTLTDTAPSTHDWRLDWTDNNTNEVGFKVYAYIACSATPTLIATLGPNVTTYTVGTGLNSFGPLRFYVTSYIDVNESAPSATVDSYMAAVTDLAVDLDGAFPYLTWTPSTTS